MGDDKSGIVGVMGSSSRERDRELLIPVADSVDADDSSSKPSSSASSSHHHSGREVKCLICLLMMNLKSFRV